MANRNAPSGFFPRAYLNGSDWNGQARQYYVPASDTDAFYIGDLVESVAGASNGIVLGKASVGIPAVAKCASGATPRGVLVGVDFDVVDLSPSYLPATKTKAHLIYVADDPQLVFEIQGDNTTTLADTCVGQYADYTVATPGAGFNAVSASVLTTATIAANPLLPLRILGLASGDFGAYARFLVSLNFHELG